jgi:DNA repair protein RecO (recombination protein O)
MKIEKTRGIVLHSLKYGDSKLIVSLYTEAFGRQSYIISGMGSRKSKSRFNLFQACFPLELEVVFKPNRSLQEIREGRLLFPLNELIGDPFKRSIALFMAEVLFRFFKEEEANPGLFEFLFRSVHWIEYSNQGVSNFHLFFLVHLCRFTGFYPADNYGNGRVYFDLLTGEFLSERPDHSHYLEPKASEALSRLMNAESDELHALGFDSSIRRHLLQTLIQYYQFHFDMRLEIKSLEVLNEVFS